MGTRAAVLGAAAWANSAVITLWLHCPFAETTAWFPWLLFGLSRVFGVGDPPDRLGLGVVAPAGTALLLAGHLPTGVQLLVPLVAGTPVLALLSPVLGGA